MNRHSKWVDLWGTFNSVTKQNAKLSAFCHNGFLDGTNAKVSFQKHVYSQFKYGTFRKIYTLTKAL